MGWCCIKRPFTRGKAETALRRSKRHGYLVQAAHWGPPRTPPPLQRILVGQRAAAAAHEHRLQPAKMDADLLFFLVAEPVRLLPLSVFVRPSQCLTSVDVTTVPYARSCTRSWR